MTQNITIQEAGRTALVSALRAVAAENDGRLIASDVLDAARDEASPLHRYFQWDDSDAAENWRLAQAGLLIRRMKITVVRGDPADEMRVLKIRSYVSLPSARREGDGYADIRDVVADDDKREEMATALLEEIARLKARFKDVQEFGEVWLAAQRAAKRMRGKARKAEKEIRP